MNLEKLTAPATCTMPGTKEVLCGQPAHWRIRDSEHGDETDLCDSCIEQLAVVEADAVGWMKPALDDIAARDLAQATIRKPDPPVVHRLTSLGQIFPGFDEWYASRPALPESWKLPPEMRGTPLQASTNPKPKIRARDRKRR